MSSADALRCGHCGGERLVVRMAAASMARMLPSASPPRDRSPFEEVPRARLGAPVEFDVARPNAAPACAMSRPCASALHFALVACATCRAVLGAVPLPATSEPDHA